jgi:hypothetical protein
MKEESCRREWLGDRRIRKGKEERRGDRVNA